MNNIQNISDHFNEETALSQPDYMTEAEYADAFKKMEADYFASRMSQDAPKLLYVTGMPGSGKTTRVAHMVQSDPALSAYVHINFDELRAYHPRYADHVKNAPLNAAARTDKSVERLIEWLATEAAKRKMNILLDDAAMGGEITRMVLSPFTAERYDVEAVAIVVPSIIARQSVYLRFEENVAAAKAGKPAVPRWVNTQEQDNAPAALVETVETIAQENFARKITIVNRSGDILYPAAGLTVSDVVKAELTRTLSMPEQQNYQKNAAMIAKYMQARQTPGPSSPSVPPKFSL